MRTLTSAKTTALGKDQGYDPQPILKIEWGGTLGTKYYGPQELTIGTIQIVDRLVSAGEANFQVAVDRGGSVASFAVEIADTDKTLLAFMKTVNIAGKVVTLLHHMQATGNVTAQAQADLLEMTKGKIGGEISWRDSDRVLRFDVVTSVRSDQVGHASEEGAFVGLAARAVGQAWPVVYGSVKDVPALKIVESPISKNLTSVNQASTTVQVDSTTGFPSGTITIKVWRVYLTGSFTDLTLNITTANVPKYTSVALAARVVGDTFENDKRVAWLSDATKIVAGMWCYISTVGWRFCSSQFGTRIHFTKPWPSLLDETKTLGETAAYVRSTWVDPKGNAAPPEHWSTPKGAEVTLAAAETEKYVANYFTSTSVVRVQAFKDVDLDGNGMKRRELVPVPADYYVVNLSDTVDGKTCTTITFPKPLRDRLGDWGDEIFVTLKSSKFADGSTSDIIKDILNTWTDLTQDATAFATAKTDLTKYPSHFAILEREDAITVAAAIAFQARCQLFLVGTTSKLKYISKARTPAIGPIVNADSVIDDSLEILTSQIEDAYSKVKATWRKSYAVIDRFSRDMNESKIIFQNNVALLGKREFEYAWTIYQRVQEVQKSVNFWGQRFSRIWRLVKFEILHSALTFELFDEIRINLTDAPVNPVNGIVQEISFTPGSPSFRITAWLPVESGASATSAYAFTDDIGDSTPGDPLTGISAGVAEEVRTGGPGALSPGDEGDEDSGEKAVFEMAAKIVSDDGGDPRTYTMVESTWDVALTRGDNLAGVQIANPEGDEPATVPSTKAFPVYKDYKGNRFFFF